MLSENAQALICLGVMIYGTITPLVIISSRKTKDPDLSVILQPLGVKIALIVLAPLTALIIVLAGMLWFVSACLGGRASA